MAARELTAEDRDALSGTFRDLYVELGANDARDVIFQIVDRFLPGFDASDAFYAFCDADDTTQDALPLGVVVETARRHLRDQQESLENARRGGEYTDRGIVEIRIQVEHEWRWRQLGMTAPVRPRGRARERRPRSRRVARTCGSRGDPHPSGDDDPDLAPVAPSRWRGLVVAPVRLLADRIDRLRRSA